MNINRSGGPYKNAIRIDHEYRTVRLERPVDCGWVSSRDPVQHRSRSSRLKELRDLAAVDGEVVPVDDRVLGVLRNRQIPGSTDHGDITMDNDASGGIRIYGRPEEKPGEQPYQRYDSENSTAAALYAKSLRQRGKAVHEKSKSPREYSTQVPSRGRRV